MKRITALAILLAATVPTIVLLLAADLSLAPIVDTLYRGPSETVNMDDLAKRHIKAMQDDGSLTNVLHMVAANGMLCNVFGHAWGSHMHITLEYMPDRVDCRQCMVCKLHQSRFLTDYK